MHAGELTLSSELSDGIKKTCWLNTKFG